MAYGDTGEEGQSSVAAIKQACADPFSMLSGNMFGDFNENGSGPLSDMGSSFFV